MFMKPRKLCCLHLINYIINHVALCYVMSCYAVIMSYIGLFVLKVARTIISKPSKTLHNPINIGVEPLVAIHLKLCPVQISVIVCSW